MFSSEFSIFFRIVFLQHTYGWALLKNENVTHARLFPKAENILLSYKTKSCEKVHWKSKINVKVYHVKIHYQVKIINKYY